MKIYSSKENQYRIVEIEGDLDASSAILVDNELESAFKENDKNILIDCEKLEYISSAGLGVFMSYIDDFKKENISLVLYNVSDKIKNVFEILGLDNLIRIADSKESAKEST